MCSNFIQANIEWQLIIISHTHTHLLALIHSVTACSPPYLRSAVAKYTGKLAGPVGSTCCKTRRDSGHLRTEPSELTFKLS